MKFGLVPLAEAEGAILAHRLALPTGVLKKGTLLTRTHLTALAAAGLHAIEAARLEAGDVEENEAARRIARAIAGDHLHAEPPFTGRVNLFAAREGLLTINRAAVDGLNCLDEAITLATLPPWSLVAAGDMVATVKIIPYSAPEAAVTAAEALGALMHVAPFRLKRAALILSCDGGTGDKVLAKTRQVTLERLTRLGVSLVFERVVPHEEGAIAEALQAARAEIVLVFGASAISDRADILPSALVAAGGRIEAFGLPVDPGNLLLLGTLGGVRVIGAPGCARSPKDNGFDHVLVRLVAGLPVSARDLRLMGVGGLLKEIASRPQPRAGIPQRVEAVILAAGRSTRMGGPNKLLTAFGSEPLIRRVVRQALEAEGLAGVTVVTGHMAAEVAAALAGLPVRLVHNREFAAGLSTSLKTGLQAVAGADGALIMLGDMPMVGPQSLMRLVSAFHPQSGRTIIVPVVAGQRGNPVLWGAAHFPALMGVEGDKGGRALLATNHEAIYEVVMDDDGALIDLDTEEAFRTHSP